MINERDKQQLKALYFSPSFNVVKNLIDEMIKDIQQRPKITDTEWGTIINAVGDDNQVLALRRLLQQFFDLSSQAQE